MDEHAGGAGDVNIQQRVVEGFVDHFFGAAVRFAIEHHRHATVGHDGPNIGEIKVDERRQGDGFHDAFDDFSDQLVHDGEGLVKGKVWHEVEQAVVVENQHGVSAAAQGFQSLKRTGHPLTALNVKRRGNDADNQSACRLGFLCDDGADAGTGTAAKA